MGGLRGKSSWRQRAWGLLALMLFTGAAGAQPAPRHVVPGLGSLSFPTSTSSAPAQAAFERGMLLLHLFEYPQAEQAFKEAERLDPAFAMAYWGEAMTATHPVWNQQNVAQGRAALAKLAPTPEARQAKAATPRERAYLAAVEILYGEGDKPDRDRRYAQAMERLASDFPEDDEAQLFHSLALLGLTQGERDVPNFLRAAEIAEGVYRRNSDHPGAAHYWIHGMDDPAHAAGALEAARALSKIAPDAGHAQHMTAHIFMALGLWPDVVAANENAERVVAEQMRAKKQPPFSCGHYSEWLQYAYFQQGRHKQAQQMLLDCRREGAATLAWMRAHPGQQVLSFKTPDKFKQRLDGSLVTMRAASIVESARYRGAAAALELDTAGLGRDAGWAHFSRGYAAVQRGDVARARASLAALQALARQPAKPDEETNTSAYLGIMASMLDATLLARAGKHDAAIEAARAAAVAYDALPFDFGPPVPVKPPHELLGELRLAANQPVAAVAEFDLALKSAPLRAQSLLGRGRALKAAGDAGGSAQAYRDLLAIWTQADADLPELAEAQAGAR